MGLHAEVTSEDGDGDDGGLWDRWADRGEPVHCDTKAGVVVRVCVVRSVLGEYWDRGRSIENVERSPHAEGTASISWRQSRSATCSCARRDTYYVISCRHLCPNETNDAAQPRLLPSFHLDKISGTLVDLVSVIARSGVSGQEMEP